MEKSPKITAWPALSYISSTFSVIVAKKVDKEAGGDSLEEDEGSLMDNKLAALINLAKHLPEEYLDQAIETLEKMKGEAEREEEQKPPDCPHCRGRRTVRNGHRRGKQQYFCGECGKSFVRTTGTALYKSRSGEAA
jgi:DNA-directed RNA polymerase subunit RPC12/RpoP